MAENNKGYVEKLFEREIVSRSDIDSMEEAIRESRSTVSSSYSAVSCATTLRRCGILETAAYMSMRLKLLRWLDDYVSGDGLNEGIAEAARFHIGEGISVKGEYGGSPKNPPKVVISWRHSDNDGTLPTIAPSTSTNTPPACKRQPMDEGEEEDIQDKKMLSKRRKG
jgi:hypothetical protein